MSARFFFFALLLAAPARGQPIEPVAVWMYDPAGLTPGRPRAAARERPADVGAVFAAIGRAALTSGLAGEGDASEFLRAAVAAMTVFRGPHELTVWDYRGHAPADGTGVVIDSLSAALVLRGAVEHETYLRTLSAILSAGSGDGVQQRLALPGGVAGVRYGRPGWPPWRDVEWCSTKEGFVVALGRGSLERYLAAKPGRSAIAAMHAQTAAAAHPDANPVAQLWVDLDRLRRGYPDSIDPGRLGGLLGKWRLSNARDFAVLLSVATPRAGTPAIVAVDATWSARSDPPTVIRHLAVSESAWPDTTARGEGSARGLPPAPPPGSFVIIMRADPRRWMNDAIDGYELSLKPSRQAKFALARRKWEREEGRAADRAVRSLGQWAILTDWPGGAIGAGGAPAGAGLTVLFPVRTDVSMDRLGRDIEASLRPFGKFVAARGAGSREWALSVGAGGVFRVASWALVGEGRTRALVGGIDLGIGADASPRLPGAARAWLGTR